MTLLSLPYIFRRCHYTIKGITKEDLLILNVFNDVFVLKIIVE
jgi:hypothetical protein